MTVGDRTRYGVAIDASRGLEDVAAFGRGIIRRRNAFLTLDPGVEIRGRIHIHPQQHLGVLHAAILRALAEEQTGFMRIDPGVIRMVRNQVGLSGQAGHPEAVVGVRG